MKNKKNTITHTFIRTILEWSGLKQNEVSFLHSNISFRRAPWVAIGGAIATIAGALGGDIVIIGVIVVLLAYNKQEREGDL